MNLDGVHNGVRFEFGWLGISELEINGIGPDECFSMYGVWWKSTACYRKTDSMVDEWNVEFMKIMLENKVGKEEENRLWMTLCSIQILWQNNISITWNGLLLLLRSLKLLIYFVHTCSAMHWIH